MSNCLVGGCTAIVIAILTVLSCAFGVASYTVAFLNWDDPPCTINALVPLQIWLVAFGTVEFYAFVMALIFMGINLCVRQGTKWQHVVQVIFLTLPYTLWLIGWSIVGAYSLFHDSMDCLHGQEKNIDLWAMTLACLIWMWIRIWGACCNK